jgi:hypothetical protein
LDQWVVWTYRAFAKNVGPTQVLGERANAKIKAE